jgi:hypothetical protein
VDQARRNFVPLGWIAATFSMASGQSLVTVNDKKSSWHLHRFGDFGPVIFDLCDPPACGAKSGTSWTLREFY